MSGTRYPKRFHKEAFQLWRKGKSYRFIAEHLPIELSHQSVKNWSRPDFDCNCGWHGWDTLDVSIVEDAKKELKFDDSYQAMVEREKLRLQFLVKMEREITEMLQADGLSKPESYSDALNLLERIYNQQRLIRGESTSIAEVRGVDNPQISLTKIAKQLNLGSPEELVKAVEEATIAKN